MGLFPPSQKATLKDRMALITDQKDIMDAGAVSVKDLGTLHSFAIAIYIPINDGYLCYRTPNILENSLHCRICRSALYQYPRPPWASLPVL